MRAIFTLLTLFVAGLSTLQAQVQWIANVAFQKGAPYLSLYDMVDDGKPVIIALGNVHTQASERLLSSGLLQALADEHAADGYGKPYSTKDVRVAFIDVQVFDDNATTKGQDIPVMQVAENDEFLNGAGWNKLYSIKETKLFWVTPDHLVHPFKGNTADELYAEVRSWNTRVRPTESPDLRLIDAVAAAPDKAEIRVQNFSKKPMHGIEIVVLKDGQEVAKTEYNASIASLEDALIPVEIPGGSNAHLTVVARTAGDVDDLNNRWFGTLRNEDAFIAGSFDR
jgi:hypothetical protein